MIPSEIARRRLWNQYISRPRAGRPVAIVTGLVAVQAQDFAGAKWSLGLRLKGATDADIERDFSAGKILRTHLLRPTWHFVVREDIRWLLMLTAPHVHQANASMYRRLGMDLALFRRSNDALAKALAGGKHLTREELRAVLHEKGISTSGDLRMSYLLMRAELDGIVCSGPRRGRQFSYALLDERAPPVKLPTRDEALAELGRRFFRSRGPATLHDLSKWSGLTVADARRGLEAVKAELQNEVIDGQSLWFSPSTTQAKRGADAVYLLSAYDEFVSSYKDRRAAVTDEIAARLKSLGNALTHILVVGDQIVGTWKPEQKRDAVIVRVRPLIRLSGAQTQALSRAADKFGEFLGREGSLRMDLRAND